MNWIICYYFNFTSKPLQPNRKNRNSTALQIREEKRKFLWTFVKVNVT